MVILPILMIVDHTTGRLMILTTGGKMVLSFKQSYIYTYFENATNQFTIDNNNARIGIGTVSPDYPLDVIGSIGFSGQTRAASGSQDGTSNVIVSNGDSDTGVFRNGVNNLSFATGGTQRFLSIQTRKRYF